MSPKPQLVRVSRRDGIVQVDLLAPMLIGDDTIERMAEEVAEIIDAEEFPRIVMNFEHVRYISSMMLGTLISLFNRVKARGGQLRLAALRERHRRLLVLVRLDGVFEMHPTPEQAAASFK
jgi:anti-sigma B factor antagonist